MGPLGKVVKNCIIVALLPVIPYTQRNNWQILQYSMNLPKGPKDPSRSLFAQPNKQGSLLFGSNWIKSVQMDPIGSKWIKMDPNGTKWIQMDIMD